MLGADKAFDRIPINIIWESDKRRAIRVKLRKVIENLYENNKYYIKTNNM